MNGRKYFRSADFESTMPGLAIVRPTDTTIASPLTGKAKRFPSIDLLRGMVMIIMALDHVRNYFHDDAFKFDPTDLSQTNVLLFFTRWITHYCAPVFVFLAGISAYLYGTKKSKKELSFFLFTRGVWLVLAELFIITLGWTFNPTYHYFNLQVIWAIGISMIVLSALVYIDKFFIMLIGVVLIAAHNQLDQVHVPGNAVMPFLWAVLHEPGYFTFAGILFRVHFPVLPWIGILCVGYYFGQFYSSGIRRYTASQRKKIFLVIGSAAILLFIVLRSGNWYGDAAHWSVQKNFAFSVMSFLNTTKYPPSLLYILMTLGPALIFLALSERPLNAFAEKISTFGRVPMFYYIVHIYLIHTLAIIAAVSSGYPVSSMILHRSISGSSALKGYGFNLLTVYGVWIAVVLLLYPLCKWFDGYKRANQSTKWWLSYL